MRWIPARRWYDRCVVLVAFLVGLALAITGFVVGVVRAVGLWRQVKQTGRALASELSEFEVRSARTERLLAESDDASRELQEALERLRISRARLEVLRGALTRGSARTRWLRAFLPV